MPKYRVNIVEMDSFGWYNRLEDTVEFQTIEAAEAFQKQYNSEENEGLLPDNMLVARKPEEVKEKENDDVKSNSRRNEG